MSGKPANDSFTRFTSTAPSLSQPQSQSTSQQQPTQPTSSQANPHETPQERVARLRAQHAAKRAAALSPSDRFIAAGRRAADVAHRATTYSLLGFSAVATVVAAYGIVSLVSHNRTQKRAWIEREMGRLDDARAAFLAGRADAEQLHLLEQERAGEELQKRFEEEKRQKRWFGAFRDKFSAAFGGTTGEEGMHGARERIFADNMPQAQVEAGDGQSRMDMQRRQQQMQTQTTKRFKMGDAEVELRPAAVQESAVPGVGLDEKGRPVPMGKMEQVRVQPTTSKARQLENSTISATVDSSRRGGPLDQWAQNATDSAADAGSGFWSSIFGGGRRSSPTSS